MKRDISTFTALLLILLSVSAFKINKRELSFKTVQIGNQIWMAENLNVSTFRNGDKIPEAKTAEEWGLASKNKTPAWCYYENSTANGSKYGKLYNFFAVSDPRGLAPEGWRVSSVKDWEELMAQCGGWYFAGEKLKSKIGWDKGYPGTNETGFSALPGGVRTSGRTSQPAFYSLNVRACFWTTTTPGNGINAWTFCMNMGDGNLTKDYDDFGSGLAVRCVKEE